MLQQNYHISQVSPMPKPFDPREQKVSESSVDRAIADCMAQREAFTKQTGIPLAPDGRMILPTETVIRRPGEIVVMPLGIKRTPHSEQIACADAIERLFKRYDRRVVLRAIATELLAQGVDISTQTINDLAECEEQA